MHLLTPCGLVMEPCREALIPTCYLPGTVLSERWQPGNRRPDKIGRPGSAVASFPLPRIPGTLPAGRQQP